MFEIPEGATVFIDNVQTRMEKHGEDNVPAVDVSLSWLAPATTLDTLCAGLADVLFSDTPPALAESRDGTLPFEPDHAHAFVRFPTLKMPIGVVFDSTGYTLTLRKIGQRRSVMLSNCKVGKLRITPQDGAQADLTLLVQCAEGIDSDVAGTLDLWQQASGWCALAAPAADEEDSRQAQLPEGEPVLP